MDVRFYKDQLDHQIQRLMELSDNLTDHGEKLSGTQKEDLRHALGPYVIQCHREAQMFFLTGNSEDYNRSHGHVLEILNDLS